MLGHRPDQRVGEPGSVCPGRGGVSPLWGAWQPGPASGALRAFAHPLSIRRSAKRHPAPDPGVLAGGDGGQWEQGAHCGAPTPWPGQGPPHPFGVEAKQRGSSGPRLSVGWALEVMDNAQPEAPCWEERAGRPGRSPGQLNQAGTLSCRWTQAWGQDMPGPVACPPEPCRDLCGGRPEVSQLPGGL